MMGKTLREKFHSEKGAIQIVEATFVFPIMFIVLFFLLYVGNAYYLRAQIDAVVAKEAIKGASYCADPTLEYIEKNGKAPSLKEIDVKPYRFFSGMNDVEAKIESETKSMIEKSTFSLFKNSVPKGNVTVKYNNFIVYSSFSVEANYKVVFPIRMLGQKNNTVMNLNSRYEVAVNESAEFIRNADMVIDYFATSKLGQSIHGVFEKINSFITSFSEK